MSAYYGVQSFKNFLIYFIFSVTCINLKYPTFFYAYSGPHFKSSLKSIIFEWNDKANSTFFFKSSLIYWITKQFLEISRVNYNYFISYSCSAIAICLILLFGNSYYGLNYYPYISCDIVYFFKSKQAYPSHMFMNESLFIIPPYFLASLSSTQPFYNAPSDWPYEISIKTALFATKFY